MTSITVPPWLCLSAYIVHHQSLAKVGLGPGRKATSAAMLTWQTRVTGPQASPKGENHGSWHSSHFWDAHGASARLCILSGRNHQSDQQNLSPTCSQYQWSGMCRNDSYSHETLRMSEKRWYMSASPSDHSTALSIINKLSKSNENRSSITLTATPASRGGRL